MTSEYTNRTHPLFHGTTNTNSVNLGITTRCTMRCPNCSVDVPGIKDRGEAKDASIASIHVAGLMMRPMRRVHVTGGEPTIHHAFPLLCPEFKDWFQAEYLTLETNGALYMKHREAILKHFDMVFITHYVKDKIYPDNYDNTYVIEQAQKDLGNRLIVEPPVEHAKKHDPAVQLIPLNYGGNPQESPLQRWPGYVDDVRKWDQIACSKWFNPGLPCGWYDGFLYPCCVSVGIDKQAFKVPMTANWREEIQQSAKGCFRCLYRGS